jgi:hypothetical protein
MFTGLNKYEAELIDAAKQREASSADVGTGWQAMTNAAGRAGGMIGRTVGKALGGVTTAEQRVADFQGIVSSVPDFNPNKVESLQEMSSALWQGGFYDQAKDMMDTAQNYQMMDAEAAKTKAQTDQIFNSMSLENQRLELEKSMNEGQLAQIDQLIADSKAGVLRDDFLSTLTRDFTRADILRIEEMITSSQAETTRKDTWLGAQMELNDATIEQIGSSINLNKQNILASEADIRLTDQKVSESKALVEDLSATELEKNFKHAQENGSYTGTFIEYQTLVANLKKVEKEGNISLYEFAKSKAGGSFEGSFEDFITSITGIDYKVAVAAAAAIPDVKAIDMTNPEREANTALIEANFAEHGNWFDKGETLPKGQTIEAFTNKIWQLYQNSAAVFGQVKTFEEIVNALTPTQINKLQIVKGSSYDWAELIKNPTEVKAVVAGTTLINET